MTSLSEVAGRSRRVTPCPSARRRAGLHASGAALDCRSRPVGLPRVLLPVTRATPAIRARPASRRRRARGRRARRGAAGGDRAAPGVRLRLLPRPPGGDHQPRHRRRRRAGADADRRRQVALLPDPGAGAAGHRGRHLAADRAHAGPGAGAAPAGHPRRLPQLDPGPGDQARRRAAVQGGRARPALPGAGAAAGAGHAAAARRLEDLGVRDRRGALRVAVGPRLPARLPGAPGAARALAGRAPDRADRDRHPGDQGRDRDQAQAGRVEAVRVVVRPAQHPVPDRAQERAEEAAAALPAHRAPGRRRASSTACPGTRPRSSRRS